MTKTISLNGRWNLYFAPENGKEPCEPQVLVSLKPIEADVPGNVELALMQAGLEPDPYYGTNIYLYRKYEFYTWWYERTFSVPDELRDRLFSLRFDGIDTIAEIWLNGEKIGESANGLVEYEVQIPSEKLRAENKLHVHILSAVNAARRADYPAALRVSESVGEEMLAVRKAPHSFGWDIAPRLLSAGLWRDVSLVCKKPTHLKEVYYGVREANEKQALLEVRYRFDTDDVYLDGFTVRVTGKCGQSMFTAESRALFVAGKLTVTIDNPCLWWPRGYGDAALYDVTLELVQKELVHDTHHCRVGMRTMAVERSFDQKDAGEFLVKVNGVPIMVKGTNWVPLDCLHSRDAERLHQAFALLCDLNCNLVRCWGGNVYESNTFYDLCDENGVLVWQDFAFACGIYDQGDDFAKVVLEEARHVIVRLRNHPSLLLWAGDNEVDQFYTNTGYLLPHARRNRISREVLPRAVAMHDPYRAYIESSPCIPEGETNEYVVPEQHNWGPRDYFKGDFYRNSTAHFISEIGYHGCPSVASLKRYIPEAEMQDFVNSPSMRTHNTEYINADARGYNRNKLMVDQVRTMFGSVPQELEAFVLASQISQAEAKKYFIESTRIKKWRRSGVIWWNLLDGWPQISDAVVDYYWDKKLAYEYIKRVQQPICVMMDEANAWAHRVVLSNDSREDAEVAYEIVCADTGETLLSGSCLSKANENIELQPIACIPGEQKLYLIRWEWNGRCYKNHYISGFVPFDFEKYTTWLEKIKQFVL